MPKIYFFNADYSGRYETWIMREKPSLDYVADKLRWSMIRATLTCADVHEDDDEYLMAEYDFRPEGEGGAMVAFADAPVGIDDQIDLIEFEILPPEAREDAAYLEEYERRPNAIMRSSKTRSISLIQTKG